MFDKNYLKRISIIVSLVGCALLIIGNFLPILTISSDTLEYTKSFAFIGYEGKYIVLFTTIALMLILLKEERYALIPLAIDAGVLVYLLLNKSALYGDCSFYSEMFSWGYGLYVLIAGTVLSIGGIIIYNVKERLSIRLKKK